MALQLPSDFENYMKSRLGPDYTNFYSALESQPPVSIRFNPAKAEGFPGDPVPWCDTGRYLPERPSFTLDPDFHGGRYYVQEASSMFLEQAVRQTTGTKKNLNVLDLCAAPGGKSTHLLNLISNTSVLISNEVIRSRATILTENIQKWGHENVIVTSNDPSDFQNIPSFFDLIILDAPCSGEGLFRKEPDAMKEWSQKNTDLCTLRQRRIVSDIWDALRPGGILIYSTCTYNENENIENLLWLKQQHEPEFVHLSIKKEWNIDVIEKNSAFGYQFFPHKSRGEGFFISVARKQGNDSSSLRAKDTLQGPAKSQVQELRPWIKNPEQHYYFLHNQTVRVFPTEKKTELQMALQRLNVLSAGTPVAEIMRNKLVPDHAFALSLALNKENFNRLPVSKDQALEYLRKNTFELNLGKPGFALIEFDGLPLGWVNILSNRFNNLYPSSWRIRNL